MPSKAIRSDVYVSTRRRLKATSVYLTKVNFGWADATNVQTGREIWKARPINVALAQLMKNRTIRFDEVRSEGKLLMSMLRGRKIIVP